MGDYTIMHDTLTALGDGVRHVVASEAQMTPVEMAEALNNYEPPSGGGGEPAKQINFIDYDGTIIDSYTAEEWASVTALPENPEHDGLISQGWNWTLQEITTQLTAAPSGPVWVGQMYVTESGDTEIDVVFQDKTRLSPYLACAVNGTIKIDWGDGTDPSEVTGTSDTGLLNTNHTYPSVGNYTISIHVINGKLTITSNYNRSYTLLNKASGGEYSDSVYAHCVMAVRIGNDTNIGSYAFCHCHSLTSVTVPNTTTFSGSSSIFHSCFSLKEVTIPSEVSEICHYFGSYCYALSMIAIPKSVTSINTYAFQYCYALSSITIPSDVTSIGNYAFQYCYTLSSITIIPSGVTSIGNYVFSYCYFLSSITVPESVTSIGNYTFAYCYSMAEYHFLPTTPPSLGGTSVFLSIPSDCKIYVPADSLDAYKTTTRWSTHASKMVGE